MRNLIVPAIIVAGIIALCVHFVDAPRCASSHQETRDGFYVFARGVHDGPHDVALCDQWEIEDDTKPGSNQRKPER